MHEQLPTAKNGRGIGIRRSGSAGFLIKVINGLVSDVLNGFSMGRARNLLSRWREERGSATVVTNICKGASLELARKRKRA
jgi:hypothetical protein